MTSTVSPSSISLGSGGGGVSELEAKVVVFEFELVVVVRGFVLYHLLLDVSLIGVLVVFSSFVSSLSSFVSFPVHLKAATSSMMSLKEKTARESK